MLRAWLSHTDLRIHWVHTLRPTCPPSTLYSGVRTTRTVFSCMAPQTPNVARTGASEGSQQGGNAVVLSRLPLGVDVKSFPSHPVYFIWIITNKVYNHGGMTVTLPCKPTCPERRPARSLRARSRSAASSAWAPPGLRAGKARPKSGTAAERERPARGPRLSDRMCAVVCTTYLALYGYSSISTGVIYMYQLLELAPVSRFRARVRSHSFFVALVYRASTLYWIREENR